MAEEEPKTDLDESEAKQPDSDSEVNEVEIESELKDLDVKVDKLEEKLEVKLDSELEEIEPLLEEIRSGVETASQFESQIDKLERELAQETEEKDKYIDRLQRVKADFSNYKKRIKKEKERIDTEATKEIIEGLLPIIDNFERALSSAQENEAAADVAEGVEMIYNQLMKLLEKKGVEAIDTVGEEFDPNVHEAVMTEASEEHESGEIIAEMKKGYKLNDLVIRPAMVKIAE